MRKLAILAMLSGLLVSSLVPIAQASTEGDRKGKDPERLVYRLHWYGDCSRGNFGYMDLNPTIQEGDPYGCAGFDPAPFSSDGYPHSFDAREGMPFLLDATRDIVARFELDGYVWVDSQIHLRVSAKVGGRWTELASGSQRFTSSPSGSNEMVFKLRPDSDLNYGRVTDLTLSISKRGGYAWGWVDLPTAELIVHQHVRGSAIPPSEGKPTTKKAQKSQRVEEITYHPPAGYCPYPNTGSCWTLETSYDERFIRVKVEDASGLPVPALVAQDVNGDRRPGTWEAFCGQMAKPMKITPGYQVRVIVYPADTWEDLDCQGTATTGTIRAAFSNRR